MTLTLNKSTKILIDNFIDTYFQNENKAANKEKIKEEVLEIADAILEQSSKDIDTLATKEDIKNLEIKILDSKYDLLKWIVTAQLGTAGLLLAFIKLI